MLVVADLVQWEADGPAGTWTHLVQCESGPYAGS